MQENFDIFFDKKIGEKLTNHAKRTMARAFNIARQQRASRTDNIHLFSAVYAERGSMGSVILKDMGIRKKHIDENLKNQKTKANVRRLPMPSEDLKKTLIKAFAIAKNLKYSYVGTEHLVYALLDSKNKDIKKVIHTSRTDKNLSTSPFLTSSISPIRPTREKSAKKSSSDLRETFAAFSEWQVMPDIMTETFTEKKSSPKDSDTPYIDKFCVNLNEEVATKGEVVIGREKEVGRLVNILGRKNKNNPLLIGQPGVGKTALVMKLAQYTNDDQAPSFLFGKRIMNLDVASLIAGTSFRGEFEARLKEIIREASLNKDILLFIDEIHNIVGAGNVSGSLDLANILKPSLSKGEVHLIGATTLKEYKLHIEKDAALDRRFQTVTVKEPTPEETKEIMLGLKSDYENFHNVIISDQAMELAVDLSCRYIQDRFLPDKAIDIIDETAAKIRSRQKISEFVKKIKTLENEKKDVVKEKEKSLREESYTMALKLKEKEEELKAQIEFLKESQVDGQKEKRIDIETEDILETVARISGVPMEKLACETHEKIRKVSEILGAKIIGQKEAIEKLSDVLMRSQCGLTSPNRPLGSFLFLGPSGVGKTFTAKVLAREFFESEKNLIRIDMSEFMERHSVSALIGAPAGYVGYGEGGRLTERVRRQPYSVILFDEIEKAHGDVFNILLQILEEGVLTDAQGTEASFKNTIIILTTNIGTEEFNDIIPAPLGFNISREKEAAKKIEITKRSAVQELENRMRPELLNRLDHIIAFQPLTLKDIEAVTKIEIKNLEERLGKLGLKLSYDKKVIPFLSQKSFIQKQGARLVRKNIQDMVESEIARMMVSGKIKDGEIKIKVVEGKLRLK